MEEMIAYLEKEIVECNQAIRKAWTQEEKIEIRAEQVGYERALHKAKELKTQNK